MTKLKIVLLAVSLATALIRPAEAQSALLGAATRFTKIAAQENHSLALKADGTVVAWGSLNTVPDGLNDVVSIAAGRFHNLALKADGTVVVWGYYYNGSTSGGTTAASVPDGLKGVIAIAAGWDRDLALKADGTVTGWGYIPDGWRHVPATVPNGLNGVVAIAAGAFHNLALKADGTITSWERNINILFHQTGPPGLNGVAAIAAGWGHSLALKSDGTVVVWGGLTDASHLTVTDGLTNIIAIAAGESHSLAVKADGTVVGWGNNPSGQITPPAGLNTAVALAAGYQHSLALKLDGTIVGWGSNSEGQLPQPEIRTQPISQALPMGKSASFSVSVTGIPPSYQWFKDGTNISGATGAEFTISSAQKGDAGTYSVIVVNSSGSVTSSNAVLTVEPILITQQPPNQTGLWAGTTAHFNVTVSGVAPLSYQWRKDGTEINGATNSVFSFPIIQGDEKGKEGSYSVIISNSYGSVTSSNALVTVVPAPSWPNLPGTVVSFAGSEAAPAPGGLTNVVSVAAGGGHRLALKSDGTVVAWESDIPDSPSPVPSGLNGVIAIAAGGMPRYGYYSLGLSHRLALKADGTVVGWGDYSPGVPDGLTGVVAIAAGTYHSMALKSDGKVVAWGNNEFGQTAVPEGLTGVVAIAAGEYFSLALKADGTVVAWGAGADGSDTENWPNFGQSSVPSGLTGVVAIAAGAIHSLALKADGTVVAWGKISNGSELIAPTAPSGLAGVVRISAAGSGPRGGCCDSLALKGDGTVVAWGPGNDPQHSAPNGLTGVVAIAAGAFHSLAIIPNAPALAIQASAGQVSLSWPLWAQDFALQSTTNLTSERSWTAVINPPIVEGLQNRVVDAISGPSKFYRLKK